MKLTDAIAHLVTRARNGNDGAFAELVAVYGNAVHRVAQEILGDVEDAEDAVQEAWLVVVQRLDTLHDHSSFGSWLYRIVANVAIRKRQQRISRSTNIEAFASAILTSQSPRTVETSLPDDESEMMQYRDLVPMAMDILSSKDRLVTVLHYFNKMQVTEIAKLLEVPSGTVKSRLHHARQKIRQEVEIMAKQPKRLDLPVDFRTVIHDYDGALHWQELFTGNLADWSLVERGKGYQLVNTESPPEHWQVAGDGLAGEHLDGETCLAIGDDTWGDYELSLLVTPLKGGNAQILFRMGEHAEHWYLFDMMLGWQAIAISKFEHDNEGKPNLSKLSVVNYPLELEREYAVSIAARGWSITTYIDGALVNQVTDFSFRSGRIALNIWQAKTLFRDVRFRLLRTAPSVE